MVLFGNHDYFGGNPDDLRANLAAIGIKTLKNESVLLAHGGKSFVLGGIDDRLMGKPNWDGVLAAHGSPHLLLSHNPDHFYEAEARGIPLTLSGHTHGGQIRLPGGPAIIRQSRYCLDEGSMLFAPLCLSSRAAWVVSCCRFVGSADPEAVLIEIVPRS